MRIESLLSEDQLLNIVASEKISGWQASNFEELGQRMAGTLGPSQRRSKGLGKSVHKANEIDPESSKYWIAMKKEIYLFICTEDKKYAQLRGQFQKASVKSQTAIVSMIAAAVAASLGVIAGSLVPLCALALLAVVRVGQNAFCQQIDLRTHLVGPARAKGSAS